MEMKLGEWIGAVFWLAWTIFISVSAYGNGERYGVFLPWLILLFIYADKKVVAENDLLWARVMALCDAYRETLEQTQEIARIAQSRVSQLLARMAETK